MGSRSTIDAVHNLAKALQSQLNFEDAEMLFRRAWNWRKGNLGATNSDTLSSLQELAICLQRRDDYSSAEIEIFLQASGNDFSFRFHVFSLSFILTSYITLGFFLLSHYSLIPSCLFAHCPRSTTQPRCLTELTPYEQLQVATLAGTSELHYSSLDRLLTKFL